MQTITISFLLSALTLFNFNGNCDCVRVSPVTRRIIYSSSAPAPIGPYSQGVLVDETLYLAGQIGLTTDGVLVDEIEAQTRLTLDNLGHVLSAAGCTFDNLKVTVLLKDMGHFAAVNEIYGEYFRKNFPARAAYEVAKLPRDALIEMEAVAIVGPIQEHKEF